MDAQSLQHIAPPSKYSASVRFDLEMLYSRVPPKFAGFVLLVLSFDGSTKTEKHGGYGSCSWILWILLEWTIVIAESLPVGDYGRSGRAHWNESGHINSVITKRDRPDHRRILEDRDPEKHGGDLMQEGFVTSETSVSQGIGRAISLRTLPACNALL